MVERVISVRVVVEAMLARAVITASLSKSGGRGGLVMVSAVDCRPGLLCSLDIAWL